MRVSLVARWMKGQPFRVIRPVIALKLVAGVATGYQISHRVVSTLRARMVVVDRQPCAYFIFGGAAVATAMMVAFPHRIPNGGAYLIAHLKRDAFDRLSFASDLTSFRFGLNQRVAQCLNCPLLTLQQSREFAILLLFRRKKRVLSRGARRPSRCVFFRDGLEKPLDKTTFLLVQNLALHLSVVQGEGSFAFVLCHVYTKFSGFSTCKSSGTKRPFCRMSSSSK